jgi:hypothetical protein
VLVALFPLERGGGNLLRAAQLNLGGLCSIRVFAARSGQRTWQSNIGLMKAYFPEDRARVAMAASQFLLRNDYVSLQEAAEQRGTEIHQLWREIIVGAGLPGCELPAFWFTT